jgi:hypothetical protein
MTFDFSGRPTWQFLRDETGAVIREHIRRWRWRTLQNSVTGAARYERGPLSIQWEYNAVQVKLSRLLFIWCAPNRPNPPAQGDPKYKHPDIPGHPNKWMLVWRRSNYPIWHGSLQNPDKYPMPWTIVRRRRRGARCLFS